jgi:Zn-dependent protease/CBS domain-containing protein
MRQSIRLGSFAGIAVGVNWSVIVILALFAGALAYDVLPASARSPGMADWVGGVIGAVVLLASLLAHEVSHALVAKHNGIGVRSITLFIFGGVTQIEGEAHTAGADFRIAAAGPATSVACGAFFAGAELALSDVGVHGVPVAVLSWLWKINLLLAAFNLIPAAPLDGGRILRAGLWRRWGDRVRASLAAARAGRGFAVVLIFLGVVEFLYWGLLGVWPALIGVFLYGAARAEEEYALVRWGVANLTVGQVMSPHPPAVPGTMTVDDLVHHHLWHYRGEAVAVTDDRGSLAGVVTIGAVRALKPERRAGTTVAKIALPLGVLAVAHADEPMSTVLERMMATGGNPALVLDADDRLAGIVTLADVERASGLAAVRQAQTTRPW